MFKRKSSGSEPTDTPGNDGPADEAASDQGAAEAAPEARGDGPFDASEVDDEVERIDFGAVLVRPIAGLEVRLEKNPTSNSIVALTLVQGPGAVQLRVLAAPRSGGLWDKNRDEIIEHVTKDGGRADPVEGPWGTEVHAAVRLQSEQSAMAGMQGMRFVGVEGPRWLLQATFMGAGANPSTWDPIQELFRSLVVVRGDVAMPVGVQLTFREPTNAAEPAIGVPIAPSLESLEPGARITEVR